MFNNVSDSLFAFTNEFKCERANGCAIERMDGRTNERTAAQAVRVRETRNKMPAPLFDGYISKML